MINERENNITNQLIQLGVVDTNDFQKFIEYCHNKSVDSGYGMNWITSIKQVKKFDDVAVVLIEKHYWENLFGGIEMSTYVVVISANTLYISDKNVFRDQMEQRKDDLRRKFDEIVSIKQSEGFVVRVRCKSSRVETDFVTKKH